MAERRMFTKKIIDSDAFLDMPLSTQSLYFHLNMRADDDGFLNNPKKIQRMIGASEDDLKLLIAKRFVLAFENGVIVIKHWRMHNLIRKDRYNQTQYVEQLEELTIKNDGSYTEKPLLIDMTPTWQPVDNQTGNQAQPQVRLGKNSIVKDSIDNMGDSDESQPLYIEPSSNKKRKLFKPPTIEEVQEYCCERKNNVNAEAFVDFYESKGWMVGKNKMKDWKAAVRTWERGNNSGTKQQPKKQNGYNTAPKRQYDYEAMERMMANQQNPPPTMATDENIRKRAEALQKSLGVM